VKKTSKLLFIGTYTKKEDHVDGHAEGIYVYRFDNGNGTLEYLSTAEGIVNPSYLALHPHKPLLYGVSERNDYDGKETGAVYSYSLDHARGSLTLINSVESRGTMPCHLSLDGRGDLLFAANYTSGSIAVYGVLQSGALTEPISRVQRTGGSINPDRQEGPHTHAVVFDDENRILFVPDLGNDQLARYCVDENGDLGEALEPVTADPGSGPRHLAFHPTMKFAYLVNELASSIMCLHYNRNDGSLRPFQTVSTLPDQPGEASAAAAVKVHPNGRFLYASNRGHDSVVRYTIDSETGLLSPEDWTATRGKTPRDIVLSPEGDFLLAANQDSDTVAVYSVSHESGQLSVLHDFCIPSPVCLVFS
jgi:6-phosphogluconolactonase